MNIKYWILVGILALGVVFLAMDNCGNSSKYQKLKGEYQVYRTLAKMAIQESIGVIKAQDKKIQEMDEKIEWLNGIIEVKNEDLAEIEEDLGELKREFETLKECQAQYDKLVEGFNLCKSINADKDTLIFNLQEKYERQVTISLEYKKMYDSVRDVLIIRDKQVKELEKINRKLKIISGLKSGLAVALAGIIIYSILKD